MRFSLYTAYHILFKMQEQGRGKRLSGIGRKGGKKGDGGIQKIKSKGKKIKICEKLTDLHKKRGVQINFICYDIKQKS